MINNFVRAIGGIGNFGVISICLFFIVFTGAVVAALRMRKAVVQRLEMLPLDDATITTENRHE